MRGSKARKHAWFEGTQACVTQLGVALTPEEPVGLILRTEPRTSATVQTFVSAVRAQAAAGRTPPKRRVR